MPALRDRSTRLMIRLALHGCSNRPFFHIVLTPNRYPRNKKPLAQLGTIDPLPNSNNEIMVSLDWKKVHKFMAHSVGLSPPVARLLGYAGYLPIHPTSQLALRRLKQKNDLKQEELEKQENEEKSEN